MGISVSQWGDGTTPTTLEVWSLKPLEKREGGFLLPHPSPFLLPVPFHAVITMVAVCYIHMRSSCIHMNNTGGSICVCTESCLVHLAMEFYNSWCFKQFLLWKGFRLCSSLTLVDPVILNNVTKIYLAWPYLHTQLHSPILRASKAQPTCSPTCQEE